MKLAEYPALKAVQVQDPYSLLATFDNGIVKLFDMTHDIENDRFFYALKDKNLFSKCKVFGDGYAVAWNEDVDLASEYIYDNGVPYEE